MRLIILRREGLEDAPGRPGGPALLWALVWPEGRQLALAEVSGVRREVTIACVAAGPPEGLIDRWVLIHVGFAMSLIDEDEARMGMRDAAPEFYDLADFAGKVAEKGASDPKLGEAAKAVQAAISDAVVAEQHSSQYPGAHGVTVELNKQYASYKAGSPSFTADQNARIDFGSYSNTAFARETGWLKAVDKING